MTHHPIAAALRRRQAIHAVRALRARGVLVEVNSMGLLELSRIERATPTDLAAMRELQAEVIATLEAEEREAHAYFRRWFTGSEKIS